ncbi:MAG TPA: bifunctional GNAT family N-acetyltransferase/carbon-nitrogen hydrolase family protein [Saprospiraceae bacterium]|nr:bifunctional GNAT family N-acetyltransferase/carbon-nitrogen hydrolase family protein [Saprospiraceae bacterium]HMP22493.1 bifunctional GNAT family N-acetyltransferase/carbon-nitrogen hydrolase family protein [Saprospiraceae bacterium]
MEIATTIKLRNLKIDDYKDLKASMIEAYAGIGGEYWRKKNIEKLLHIFPEGQLCIEVDGKVVASALSIIVSYRRFGDDHTYRQVTGNYSFNTHDPNGDVLYGIDVFVHPNYRGMRLGRRLYDARKELCENLNLRSIMAGGRIPNYMNFSNELSPRDYIDKVKLKEIYDPVLTFQMSNDFHVRKVLRGYLPGDTESKEYATLLEWNNIYYQAKEQLINAPKEVVRLGLVQWQMRLFKDFDALVEQVEYFVDAVSNYKSDFILFPEFFNAPLMADYNHLGEALAIRELAKYTDPLRRKFMEFAVAYNVNIITGSMPIVENGSLLNVAYLCRRDGTWESFYKIHPTPSEVSAWGMVGGNKLQILDTDCGRVGILICYDVEFPELARIYAEQGMQILFVPFLTDTQNGYNRVRRCAQARAVENECYVAIAGCVGNLPRVNNMDIQFAQSAIFTPSDFQFPTDAVAAEATPNTEMTIIADINMSLLKELHEFGSVQNLKDRRKDLYEVLFRPQTEGNGLLKN